MFQKERMLNLALDMLPAKFDQVVWMDCDIVYVEDDWPDRVGNALKNYSVVQPYKHAVSLPMSKTTRIGESHWSYYDCYASGRIRRSFAYYNMKRKQFASLHEGHVGYVWAGRREFLEKHKFYDAIVTGAGDLFMVMAFCGFFGWMDHIEEFANLTDAACNHFFDWAFPVQADTNGKVGYTDDLISHLWHGEINNRNYLYKSRALQATKFDPSVDLAIDENGCWRWNSDKPLLHELVEDIFKSQQVGSGH